jgi:long-chain acyl-CoA synthetase
MNATPFWRRVESHTGTALISTNGTAVGYPDLVDAATKIEDVFRSSGARQLAFLSFTHTPSAVATYLACLRSRMLVPLLLQQGLAPELLAALIDRYAPDWLLGPLAPPLPTGYAEVELPGNLPAARRLSPSHASLQPDLALLVTTSGSTGSHKLVRLSYKAVSANASAIADYLSLDPAERAISSMPLSYSFGMSILNSHLAVGGSLVLSEDSVLHRAFWERVETHGVTSLSGVPSTFDMLERAGVHERSLPSLRTFTQAGGRMREEVIRRTYQRGATFGRRLFVMYGQAEAAPRISYVPPSLLSEKIGSIGIALPGGALRLAEDSELLFEGPNVMMGYAMQQSDLARGDEQSGRLATGDLARVDADGFHYITGRKTRFVKLGGMRTNLDELENGLGAASGMQVYCVGEDERLFVLPVSAQPQQLAQLGAALRKRFRISPALVKVRVIYDVPLMSTGKVDYRTLRDLAETFA